MGWKEINQLSAEKLIHPQNQNALCNGETGAATCKTSGISRVAIKGKFEAVQNRKGLEYRRGHLLSLYLRSVEHTYTDSSGA